MPRTFGEVLVDCRKNGLGLKMPPVDSGKLAPEHTQVSLADDLNIGKDAIGRWENNRAKPSVQNFTSLLKIFERDSVPEEHAALLTELKEAYESWPNGTEEETESFEHMGLAEDQAPFRGESHTQIVNPKITSSAIAAPEASAVSNPVVNIEQRVGADRTSPNTLIIIAVIAAIAIAVVAIVALTGRSPTVAIQTEQTTRSTTTLTEAEHIRQLKEDRARKERTRTALIEKADSAAPSERDALNREIEVQNREIANIDLQLADTKRSFAQRKAGIEEIQGGLADAGWASNEQLEAARQDLALGNTDKTEERYKQILEDTQEPLDQRADAFFRLGKIAENEVEWTDAADNYARSVNLVPSFERYEKAIEFLGKTADYDKAISLSAEAVSFAREAFGNKDARTANLLYSHARALMDKDELDGVDDILAEVLSIDRETIGTKHEDYGKHLSLFGSYQHGQGLYIDARRTLEQALEITAGTEGKESETYAQGLITLSAVLVELDALDDALIAVDEALVITEKLHGTVQHPTYAEYLTMRGRVLFNKGDQEQAGEVLSRSMELTELTYGSDHPQFAIQLSWRAFFEMRQGNPDGAVRDARHALAISTRLNGPRHRNTLGLQAQLSFWLLEAGFTDEGLAMAQERLAATVKAYPESHPTVADAHSMMALSLRQIGDFETARDHADQARKIIRETHGPTHSSVSFNDYVFVLTLQDLGKFDLAGPIVDKITSIEKEMGREARPRFGLYLNSKAVNAQSLKEFEEAKAIHVSLVELTKKKFGPESVRYGLALSNFSAVLLDLGNPEAALGSAKQALSIYQKIHPEGHPSFLYAYSNYASALSKTGEKKEAETVLREGIAKADKLDRTAVRRVDFRQRLGRMLRDDGRKEEALIEFQQAFDIALDRLRPSQVKPYSVAVDLANLLDDLDQDHEGIEVYRKAADLARETTVRLPIQAIVFNNLALDIQDDFPDEAEQLFRESLARRDDENDPNGKERTTSMINLAFFLGGENRADEGEALIQDALQLDRETVGRSDIRYARHLNGLGNFLRNEDRDEEAEQTYRQAIAASARAGTANGDDHAWFVANLGGALTKQLKFDEAEAALKRALQILEDIERSESEQYASHLWSLAGMYDKSGRVDKARATYHRALEIAKKTEENDVRFYATLGWHYLIHGEPETAISLLKEAIQISEKSFGETSWQTIQIQALLARAIAAEGDLIDAVSRLTQTRRVAEEHLEVTSWVQSYVLLDLGRVLLDLDQTQKAEESLDAALEAIKLAEPDTPKETYRWGAVLISKADLMADQDAFNDAKKAYLEGLSIARSKNGDSHPETKAFAKKALKFLNANFPTDAQTLKLSADFAEIAN